MSVAGDDIFVRLNRIYAAVGETVEVDLTKFPPDVITGDGFFGIFQDFSGGLHDNQLQNLAHSLIHNIANFRDHLSRYAKNQSADIGTAIAVLDDSASFQLVKDLSNNDKHGYPPPNGGFSKRSPQLVSVTRVMQLTTGAAKGSSVMMTLGTNGPIVRSTGGGSAAVVVTGEVEDGNGERINGFKEITTDAVAACEQAIAKVSPALG